jgi:hypothetical protein
VNEAGSRWSYASLALMACVPLVLLAVVAAAVVVGQTGPVLLLSLPGALVACLELIVLAMVLRKVPTARRPEPAVALGFGLLVVAALVSVVLTLLQAMAIRPGAIASLSSLYVIGFLVSPLVSIALSAGPLMVAVGLATAVGAPWRPADRIAWFTAVPIAVLTLAALVAQMVSGLSVGGGLAGAAGGIIRAFQPLGWGLLAWTAATAWRRTSSSALGWLASGVSLLLLARLVSGTALFSIYLGSVRRLNLMSQLVSVAALLVEVAAWTVILVAVRRGVPWNAGPSDRLPPPPPPPPPASPPSRTVAEGNPEREPT